MSLINTQELGDLIRKWVYYDNLIATFNKQLGNARKLRNQVEDSVITQLTESKMENAVIQIGGGRLSVVEEKHSQPLSVRNLETFVRDYFTKKGTPGEADALLAHIRKCRTEGQTVDRVLKRST